MARTLVAPDKFRGTLTAAAAAAALAVGVATRGGDPVAVPLSDGGEGLLEACAAVAPEEVETVVTGPGGRPVTARWRVGGRTAVVESARASGLALVGGAAGNDPLGATTRGTGELLVAAAGRVGPDGTVLVGLGGSATTDGGAGALEAVAAAGGLGGVRLVAACDVDVPFLDAGVVFGPQKGADPDQVAQLTGRLAGLADTYRARYGVDVSRLPRAGAAGGLGGALAVLGAELRSGYELVSTLVGLPAALDKAAAVVTGEGALDATSFAGKVVGGVVGDARARGLPTLVVAGRCSVEGTRAAEAAGCTVVSLTVRFGAERATGDTSACLAATVADWLGSVDHSG